MKDTKSGTKKKEGNLLTWKAVEPAGPRRWWSFVIVGYFTTLLVIVLVAFENWPAALLTAAVGVTFFVVYLPRPKTWEYTLTRHRLKAVREHRRGGADELSIDLRDYHSADVHPLGGKQPGTEVVVITLWPRRRLARDVDIYLPSDATVEEQIFERVDQAASEVQPHLRSAIRRSGPRS